MWQRMPSILILQRTSFLGEMIKNLNNKFKDMETMNLFSVLSMRPLKHFKDEEEINEWGNEEIKTLSEFYTKKKTNTVFPL